MIHGFVKVFQNLDGFRFEGSFEGWIRKIMVRECISHLRKQQFVVYDGTLFEDVVRKEITMPDSMDAEYIQLLIDALPEGYRAVFILFVVEGYKHHEIATLLGVTENTSKSQLFKARKLLQEKLREQNIVGYGTE
jgi:RNA polymerase sigma-70 factor (ECF subfamily)